MTELCLFYMCRHFFHDVITACTVFHCRQGAIRNLQKPASPKLRSRHLRARALRWSSWKLQESRSPSSFNLPATKYQCKSTKSLHSRLPPGPSIHNSCLLTSLHCLHHTASLAPSWLDQNSARKARQPFQGHGPHVSAESAMRRPSWPGATSDTSARCSLWFALDNTKGQFTKNTTSNNKHSQEIIENKDSLQAITKIFWFSN